MNRNHVSLTTRRKTFRIIDEEYANQVDCVPKENSPAASADLNGKAVQKVQRLIGYARVSTNDQNLNLQRDALKAAGCVKIFADTGVSGSLASRPQLDRMLKELRAGDCLPVWKLDRLGRSVRHLIILLDDLRVRGITFRSLTQDIDTSTAMGRAMMHIMGVMAELERENIVERVNAGLAGAQARRQDWTAAHAEQRTSCPRPQAARDGRRPRGGKEFRYQSDNSLCITSPLRPGGAPSLK